VHRRVRHPDEDADPDNNGQPAEEDVYDLVRREKTAGVEGDALGWLSPDHTLMH
jgi:hypothetical protein